MRTHIWNPKGGRRNISGLKLLYQMMALVLVFALSVLSSDQALGRGTDSVSSKSFYQKPGEQIGFCRKCKRPDASGCDDAARQKSNQAWDDFVRKWRNGVALIDRADYDAEVAKDKHDKYLVDEAEAFVEITAVKTSILAAVKSLLSKGGKVVLEGAATLFGLYSTYEWIRWDIYPEWRDFNQAMIDAGKEMDAGAKLMDESYADLQKALAIEKECKDQWKKDDMERAKRQALLDKAKQLRDSWALDGSALFKDPNDPIPMDAAAALKRAIDILSKQGGVGSSGTPNRQSSLRLNGARLLKVNLHLLQQSQSDKSPEPTFTDDQLGSALQQVEAADKILQEGKTLMSKRKAFLDSWGGQLIDFAAQCKESVPQPR
ncbi:MAG TPA: hypothetical protein VI431_05055 [Candidatus Acidoferrum sp.]